MSTISGCYGQTHIGKVRKENEDNFLLESWPSPPAVLAVIADGMGSYGGGAIAAGIVTETFAELLLEALPSSRDERYEMLLSAFYRADSRIRSLQDSSNPEMGATVIACIATEDELLHLHAGDCQIFQFTGERIAYVSRDHSVVRTLVDSGEIDEEEALVHPMRNVVTSCLGGPRANLRFTVDPRFEDGAQEDRYGAGPFRTLHRGDVIVMCSDGLWSEVPGEELLNAVRRNRLAEGGAEGLSGALIDLALSGPASDNITAIVLDIDAIHGRRGDL